MSDRKTQTIPEVQGIEPTVARVLRPMREWINRISGRTGSPIARLEGTVTDDDRTNKINEIIERLNS